MPIAGATALLIIGAILRFAVDSESINGLDLGTAGVILMLAGAAGLLLPLLTLTRQRSGEQGAASRQDAIDDGTLVEHQDDGLALEDRIRAQNGHRLWMKRDRL